ncbi:hypothetical protein [Actinomadura verrucosospora]|uniref:Uncharacterized protein n=1 Tax=Actinomadura verrucosospora TaxID=46165 RepID=A0A7D3ZVE4_ACTVE|nr:hypothetical protein [Actinomadura verrucosospora]QKG27262.1 hypothetical protein ACTIVE_8915 [Actinomadura verrucosospora]
MTTRPLTFADNQAPSVGRGTYTITVAQTLPDDLPLGGEAPPAPVTQRVEVTGLRLHIGEQEVHGAYPPAGSGGLLDTVLPHIAFERRVLPWENRLDWQAGEEQNRKRPWLALLLFTRGEIVDDPEAAGLTTAGRAGDLLVDATDVTVPVFSPTLTDDERAQPVRTIRLTKETFAQIAPRATEVAHLAHVRSALPGEMGDDAARRAAAYSFITANRLPTSTGGPYVAHLVSLEGHTGRFTDPSTLTRDIRLLSLYSWTFTSGPRGHASFSGLREQLLRSAMPTGATDNSRCLLLRLPQPETTDTGKYTKHIRYRLANGFVPVAHDSGAPEDFAWYRGPLVPYKVTGPPPADAEYGIDDLGYQAAHALGRGLVLADQDVAAALAAYLDRAHARLADACRIIAPQIPAATSAGAAHGDGENLREAVISLLGQAGDTWREAFRSVVVDGEPAHFHAAVLAADATADGGPAGAGAVREEPGPGAGTEADLVAVLREGDLGSAAAPAMTELMSAFLAADDSVLGDLAAQATAVAPAPSAPGEPDGTEAVESADPDEPTIVQWLDRLRRLEQVPFDHLVPHAGMLPEESVRVFRVDATWVEHLLNGAFAAAERSSIDREALKKLRDNYLERPCTPPRSGILIRSQLVSAYPETRVSVSAEQADGSTPTAGEVLRCDRVAPDVLLCLFDGLPREIVLHEPMQGLHIGIQRHEGASAKEDRVSLRTLVDIDPLKAGQALAPAVQVKVPYRSADGVGATVLNINDGESGLATAIASALGDKYKPDGTTRLSPGQLALQMIQSPETAALTVPAG